MTPPRVSVVMPAWNVAGSVARAVDSLRRQTLDDWELIAVDDGSTDETAAWLQAEARRDHRLRVLLQPHRGLVSALNHGLAQARSSLIARLDADDEVHPERFELQVGLLDRRHDLGLVGSLVEYHGDRRSGAGFARYVDWLNGIVSPEEHAINRFIESPLAHPTVMFRRELLDRHGTYAEGQFPEDYELWLRWLDAGVRMAKVPAVLLTWYDTATRLSRVDPRYAPSAFYQCKAIYLARWLARHVVGRRPILVWGAGRLTRRRVELLEAQGTPVAGFIDIDPRKIGRQFGGREVIGPEALSPPGTLFVLGYVGKQGARELIRARLRELGHEEGADFLMAA